MRSKFEEFPHDPEKLRALFMQSVRAQPLEAEELRGLYYDLRRGVGRKTPMSKSTATQFIQTIRGSVRDANVMPDTFARIESGPLALKKVEAKVLEEGGGDPEEHYTAMLPFVESDIASIRAKILSSYRENWYVHLVHALLINTGLRPSDCTTLRLDDCMKFRHTLNGPSYSILWVESKKTKGERRRLVVFPRLHSILDSWPVALALALAMIRTQNVPLTGSENLFEVVSRVSSYAPLGSNLFSKQFTDFTRQAIKNDEQSKNKGLYSYRKHHFSSISNGFFASFVQDFLLARIGHSSGIVTSDGMYKPESRKSSMYTHYNYITHPGKLDFTETRRQKERGLTLVLFCCCCCCVV